MMKLMHWLFGHKDAGDVAAQQLAEARLALLEAEAGREHFAHTVNMLKERISRLDAASMKNMTVFPDLPPVMHTRG